MKENPPSGSTILNVCIIPPDVISNKCVELSQSLKSDDALFVLDGVNKFPHMTVFMARFADSEIKNVVSAAEQILTGIKSFLCRHTGYFMTAGEYLEASYDKSEELIKLHELLIDKLKNHRINPGNPFEESYFAPYTTDQQKNAKETGYDLAHDLYRPHITLTRYKESKTPKTLPNLPPGELSFQMNKICVYKANDNGAVYEKLKEFSIK